MKKGLKKALKIIGIVLLAIVVVIGILVALNWKYVIALINGLTMNAEQLGKQRVENAEKALTSVNKYMDAEIRPLTDEEREKIEAGELSQTEVMAQIIAEATGTVLDAREEDGQSGDNGAAQPEGEAPVEQPAEDAPAGQGSVPQNNAPEQTAPSKNETPKPSASSSDQLVAACVNKLYGLQAQYTAQLDGLAARARAYYDQQKPIVGAAAAKSGTFSKFSGEVSSMEGGCDAKVEAALGELSSGLKAIGADTSIVGTLRSAYESEKSNQRAAYVNRYLK